VYATKELDVKAGVVRDTVVNMTKKYSPIIAINATGFDKENKNCPRGTVGSRGKIDYFDSSRPSVALAYDGTLNIVNTTTEKTYAKPNNPFWVASFMPILVNNGKITQNEQNNLKKIDPAPRVAIGQKDNKNEFMIILVDGRRSDSPGINYYQMSKLFYDRGCKVAYNLDGGGSATMVFNGKIINKPSDPSGPRPVIDSLFVRDIN
jgi:exopolysaccharide biosynthesis protein